METLKAAIWFCDLRGFTALSEHLPRREVISLLNRWFDAVGGASAAFARFVSRPMRRVGQFTLRGIEGEGEVYAP